MIRWRVLFPPYIWLLVLFLLPFGIVFKISLSDYAISVPPYDPKFDFSAGMAAIWQSFQQLDFESYKWLIEDRLYFRAYVSSLTIAAISTFVALVIAYPMAYAMARSPQSWRALLMMLVILPFWSSFLIRIYAWIGILSNEGFLNMTLEWMGLPTVQVINTNTAVYIGVVYAYLPFMILPIYAALDRMDPSLLEAAEDLGCTRIEAFWRITWPLSRPGVIAGCFLVFIPVIGEFVIPSLLGGSNTLMIGKILWEEFFNNRDWPVASAVAVVLLFLLIIPIVLFQRQQLKDQEAQT
ncbi:MAG: ABC transporter permease subunit [Pseudomonadota bacterium]